MSRLVQAGIFAAALQSAAIVVLTVMVWLSWQQDLSPHETSSISGATLWTSAAPFLKYGYILTSIAVAFTNNSFFDATATHIRRTFRRSHPTKPNSATVALFSQLCLVSFGFMIFGLEDPPVLIASLGHRIGYPWLGVIVWPALWSIGIATFGATARAINRSLDWPRYDQ